MIPSATTGLEVELLRLTRNVLTASGTGITGDLIAQFASQDHSNNHSSPLFAWDARRTLALAAFNAAYTGAFQHYFFPQLNALVGSPALRLLINQGVMIPLLYYPIFCWVVPRLRARNSTERRDLRRNICVKRLIPRNWAFWLPLQFVQFTFVPASAQVAFCSVCGLVWSVLLSLFASGSSSSTSSATTTTAAAQVQVQQFTTAASTQVEQPVTVSVEGINREQDAKTVPSSIVERIIPQQVLVPPTPAFVAAVPATS